MKIILEYFDDSPADMDSDAIGSELERIGGMIAEGFTSGELVDGKGRGWWHIDA